MTATDGAVSWLLQPEQQALAPESLLTGLVARLSEGGLTLLRAGAYLPTSHPELNGHQLIWSQAKGCQSIPRPHTVYSSKAYLGTPAQDVMEKPGHHVRVRLDRPRAELPYPVLGEIVDEGGTDYLITSLSFAEAGGAWISFSTARQGGFVTEEIEGLLNLSRVLSLHFQLAQARSATESLLTVYLGANAARRVAAGEFRRGTGESISAAIWFCDLRGFTTLGDSMAPRELVGVLDNYFECIAGPIEGRGGEILKFIGDAALAIFPVGSDGPAGPVQRALAAAEHALDSLGAWSAADVTRPKLKMGVALHLGDVHYGNIGGRHRLDFTVIGGAVNEVCRVESLCKTLHSSLLMTSAFSHALGRTDTVVLGSHVLRGVSEPQEILTLRSHAPPIHPPSGPSA
jgi:adenylate cyclase